MLNIVHGIDIADPGFLPGPFMADIDNCFTFVRHEPFLFARFVSGWIEIQGLSSYFLGNCIAGDGDQPDGIFASWRWDGTRLTVTNDRYGFHPLFYFSHENSVGISRSVIKLLELGAPTDLDEEGLAVFLRLGFFIGDHTPFKYIRALPPNVSFEWSAGKLRISGDFLIPEQRHISRDEAIDRYIVAVENAIRKRLPADGKCALPLSGGRDSRHLLLGLCDAGCPPTECITVLHTPPLPNSDLIAAANLTAALKLKHVVCVQHEHRLNAEILKNVKTGMCSDEHTHYMVLSDYLADRFSTVFDGIGPDTLTGQAYHFAQLGKVEELEGAGLLRYAEYLIGAFPKRNSMHEIFLANVLQPEQYRRFNRTLAVESIVKELTRHSNAPNPIASFFFWNRTRREIALVPFLIMDRVPNVFCPYLDKEVYDLLSSLPTSMFLDLNFRTDALKRAFPNYRNIPYEESVPAPVVCAESYFRRFGQDLLHWTVKRRSSKLVHYSRVLRMSTRAAIDAAYARSLFSYRWIGPHTVYLLQLEGIIEQALKLHNPTSSLHPYVPRFAIREEQPRR